MNFYVNKYKYLLIEINNGIATIVLNRPKSLNSANMRLHWEMGEIWKDLDEDKNVKVIIVTGSGKAFSVGGDFEMVENMTKDVTVLYQAFKDTQAIVYNMIQCSKPIISAINGIAVGAGMVIAILSDISIASDKAEFNDGHIRLGVAAGDHACSIWPILCGMAKTKYYLLTGKFISATEAERIGLISLVVPHEKLMEKVLEIANDLKNGPQHAIKFTKQALNQWLKQACISSFDYSCALEMLGFIDKDVKEGYISIKEKRKPQFPSAKL
jgi:enoyl-CoA hydratase